MLLGHVGDLNRVFDPEENDVDNPNVLHHAARWSAELTQLLLSRLEGFAALGSMLVHVARIYRWKSADWSFLSPLGVAVQAGSPVASLLLDATSMALGLEGAPGEAADVAHEALIALCERFVADPPAPPVDDADRANALQRDKAAVAIAERLVAAGALPAAEGAAGTRPVFAAACAGDVPLLEYFFTLLDPTTVAEHDENWRTALGGATSRGYAQCLRRILTFLRTSLPVDQVQPLLAVAFLEATYTLLQVADRNKEDFYLSWGVESFKANDPDVSEDRTCDAARFTPLSLTFPMWKLGAGRSTSGTSRAASGAASPPWRQKG